jgi:hypothetical protein
MWPETHEGGVRQSVWWLRLDQGFSEAMFQEQASSGWQDRPRPGLLGTAGSHPVRRT